MSVFDQAIHCYSPRAEGWIKSCTPSGCCEGTRGILRQHSFMADMADCGDAAQCDFDSAAVTLAHSTPVNIRQYRLIRSKRHATIVVACIVAGEEATDMGIAVVRTTGVLAVIPVLLMTACAVTPPIDHDGEAVAAGSRDDASIDEEVPAEKLPSDQMFWETSVTRRADGTIGVTQRQVTLAEQLAARDFEFRRQEALKNGTVLQETMGLTLDGSCASTSLRMFSRSDWLGDVICFSGTTEADLAAYVRNVNSCGTNYWYDFSKVPGVPFCSSSISKFNFVKSLHAGNQSGLFNGHPFVLVCQYKCATWAANTSRVVTDDTCRYVHRAPFQGPC